MRTLITLLFYVLIPFTLLSQPFVESTIVQTGNIDLTASTVVGEITINPESAGKVVVRFDGYCVSSPGDQIVLAASDSPNWGPNDDNTSVEAVNTDLNRTTFSHTRVYDVSAGSHTFYAIAQNYVETAGDGMASIYGNLMVEFLPSDYVAHQGISETSLDVTNETTVGEVTLNAPTSGKVVVWFDGLCYATPGDRIVLGASDIPSWSPNDGNVAIEGIDTDYDNRTFAHSRVYDVGAGNHTFYAVAQNYVETGGDAITSIYASLTAVFVPDDMGILEAESIVEGNLDVTDEQIVGQASLDPDVSGKVIVRFSGACVSTPGDRIILAASDEPSWSPNTGAVAVEAYDSDINRNSFSHTQVYEVTPGSQTFYAVAHNYVETDGSGTASIYGTLTATFVPDAPNATQERKSDLDVSVFPNPTQGPLQVKTDEWPSNLHRFRVINPSGKIILQGTQANLRDQSVDLTGLPDGLYFLQLLDAQRVVLHTQQVVKESR